MQLTNRTSRSVACRATARRPMLHMGGLTQIRLHCLDRETWRRDKRGPVLRLPLMVRNAIRVAQVHTSSMLSNTCCTTLLMQGAPASASSPT